MSETLNESVRVRLSTELREQLETLSEQRDRPVGYLIRQFIREGLARELDEQEAVA